MSSELGALRVSSRLEAESESDRAMVVDLESLGPMVLVPMRPRPSPSRQVRLVLKPAVMFSVHVSGHSDSDNLSRIASVRFLLEHGLRFRNLGVCGHDSI